MRDIITRAKEFIGLGSEEELIDLSGQKSETPITDYNTVRVKPAKKTSGPSDYEISIYEPRAYENSLEISARLRQGNPVIVNLKYLDTTEGTRLIDFVCGAAFAIDGHMTKIADSIFLLSPTNVSISNFSEMEAAQEAPAKEGLLHNRL